MQSKEMTEFYKHLKNHYSPKVYERWKLILSERKKKKSYKQIGEQLQITRQRVAQIDKFLNEKMHQYFSQK